MKKVLFTCLAVIFSGMLLLCGGCDGKPTKIGGGGKPQSYNPLNGRYN